MKLSLLELLACPACGADLELTQVTQKEGEEIIEGTLSCAGCQKQFPIVRGIPRLVDRPLSEEERITVENFGYEWNTFDHLDEKYAAQFLDWIQPVKPSFFEGKVVLEGGCGKGRHTLLAAQWGAKTVVGIDLSSAVEVAFRNTRHLSNVHIVQADIFQLPLKKAFDFVFSIGVVHHTSNPEKAFLSLVSHLKPGGAAAIWIYGAENNRWITTFIDPIRKKITSKIPPSLLYYLSFIPSFLVYVASKLVYAPLAKLFPKLPLPYKPYLVYISRFGFREIHSIVFDHLTPPLAFYISKEQYSAWWEKAQAQSYQLTWHNQNSWAGFGQF